MRLIDADALLAMPIINGKYDRKNANPRFIYGIQTVAKMIKNAPAVEAVPAVHGEWDNEGYCTICGERCIGNNVEEWRTDFCPHCGAYMRKGKE